MKKLAEKTVKNSKLYEPAQENESKVPDDYLPQTRRTQHQCCIFEVSDISDELIFRQIKSRMLTGLVLTVAPVASVEAKPSIVLTT